MVKDKRSIVVENRVKQQVELLVNTDLKPAAIMRRTQTTTPSLFDYGIKRIHGMKSAEYRRTHKAQKPQKFSDPIVTNVMTEGDCAFRRPEPIPMWFDHMPHNAVIIDVEVQLMLLLVDRTGKTLRTGAIMRKYIDDGRKNKVRYYDNLVGFTTKLTHKPEYDRINVSIIGANSVRRVVNWTARLAITYVVPL